MKQIDGWELITHQDMIDSLLGDKSSKQRQISLSWLTLPKAIVTHVKRIQKTPQGVFIFGTGTQGQFIYVRRSNFPRHGDDEATVIRNGFEGRPLGVYNTDRSVLDYVITLNRRRN